MDKKEPTIVSYGEYNQNLEIETIDDSIAMEDTEPFKKK